MKKLAIFGCSHAAGFEIHGGQDSKENRESSFGNLLAKHLGCAPMNAGMGGASNAAIARTVLNWVRAEQNDDDVHVLVAWTESARLEYPSGNYDYRSGNLHTDYWLPENDNYLQINMGLDPKEVHRGTKEEIITYWQQHNASYEFTSQIEHINLVLQIQYMLKAKGIDYTMCNTMYSLDTSAPVIQSYMDFVDEDHYLDLRSPELNFYHHYAEAGHVNENAQYWHHGEEPHRLFALKLYDFIKDRHVAW